MAPARRPGLPPSLTVEAAPAYELLHSIVATLDTDDAETYEIGAAWVAEARARAGEDLLDRLSALSFGQVDTFRHLVGLAYGAPAPRDVPSFLTHLRETDPDEIKLHLVQFYARDTRRMTPPSTIRAAAAGDPDAVASFSAHRTPSTSRGAPTSARYSTPTPPPTATSSSAPSRHGPSACGTPSR